MRKTQNLSNNGVAKNMQQLKRVIKICLENEWLNNNPFLHYSCKLIETHRGYLTALELNILTSYSFSNLKLERVKDLFVFCCYTGLSYADLSKLTRGNFEEDNNGITWINLARTKTGNKSLIPVLPIAQSILTKYEGIRTKSNSVLPIISNQNLNKYLKEVATIIGIDKIISMHLARHTFATTVTLERGIDITTVSRMLGHKNIKTTQIYAKVTQLKIASDMKILISQQNL